jgi:hypothetical protein
MKSHFFCCVGNVGISTLNNSDVCTVQLCTALRTFHEKISIQKEKKTIHFSFITLFPFKSSRHQRFLYHYFEIIYIPIEEKYPEKTFCQSGLTIEAGN